MNKRLRVRDLTLSSLRSLIGLRYFFESSKQSDTNREISKILGNSVDYDSVNDKVTRLIGEKLCSLMAEKIAFEDDTPLEPEDFETFIPVLLETDFLEGLVYDREYSERLMRLMIEVVLGAIRGMSELPYYGYENWLQTYLDLANERGFAVPEEMGMDREVDDEMIRRMWQRDDYLQAQMQSVEGVFTDEHYRDNILIPLVLSNYETPISDEDYAEAMNQVDTVFMPNITGRLREARSYLRLKYFQEAKRIFG